MELFATQHWQKKWVLVVALATLVVPLLIRMNFVKNIDILLPLPFPLIMEIALNKILVDQRTPILNQHGRKRAQVFPQAHGGGGVAYEVEAFGGGVLWHFGELCVNFGFVIDLEHILWCACLRLMIRVT